MELGLNGEKDVLEGKSDSQTCEDLIPDELGVGRVDRDCGNESHTDSREGWASDEPIPVSACRSGRTAADEDSDASTEHERDDGDTGLSRRVRFDRFVVQRQLVDPAKHGEHGHEDRNASSDLRSVLEDRHGNQRSLVQADLPPGEDDDEHTSYDELEDNAPVGPRVFVAAVAQGEEQTNDDAEYHGGAEIVEAGDLLPQGFAASVVGLWRGTGGQ